MSASPFTLGCRTGGVVLGAMGLGLVAYDVVRFRQFPFREDLERYLRFVEQTVQTNRMSYSVTQILWGQGIGILLGPLLAILSHDRRMLFISLAAALLPPYSLLKTVNKRILDCDKQAGGFTLSLANAMKTVPNIGSALEAIQPLLREPLRQEISLALAEMSLGSTVDTALLNASARTRSKGLDASISALLVGRQVGGNLTVILERTADTMREMSRLEGVLQTKTAEGRAQLLVLLLLPGVIVVAFSAASPGYFIPLQATWMGRFVLIAVVGLWLLALGLARSIMAVNL